eukprot:TRINITY_DN4824_c3_g1_i1.p1 TRINITY_DN4824_c3_g1~~TRINITY_DN4824_c3_g1_i1.p1  ORF type:complete len:143 (-),score=25.68 TRINITY_DN4824_c3_g1_i1:543-971(-)
MAIKAENCLNVGFILKLVELVLGFIIVMIYTCGDSKFWADNFEGNNLGIATCVGYFTIILIIMIGMICGDKAKVQLILFNLCGFFFFLSSGSMAIDAYKEYKGDLFKKFKDQGLAMGSMAIINGAVFLADTLISVLALRKSD